MNLLFRFTKVYYVNKFFNKKYTKIDNEIYWFSISMILNVDIYLRFTP